MKIIYRAENGKEFQTMAECEAYELSGVPVRDGIAFPGMTVYWRGEDGPESFVLGEFGASSPLRNMMECPGSYQLAEPRYTVVYTYKD